MQWRVRALCEPWGEYSEAEVPKLLRPMKSENIDASTPRGQSFAA